MLRFNSEYNDLPISIYPYVYTQTPLSLDGEFGLDGEVSISNYILFSEKQKFSSISINIESDMPEFINNLDYFTPTPSFFNIGKVVIDGKIGYGNADISISTSIISVKLELYPLYKVILELMPFSSHNISIITQGLSLLSRNMIVNDIDKDYINIFAPLVKNKKVGRLPAGSWNELQSNGLDGGYNMSSGEVQIPNGDVIEFYTDVLTSFDRKVGSDETNTHTSYTTNISFIPFIDFLTAIENLVNETIAILDATSPLLDLTFLKDKLNDWLANNTIKSSKSSVNVPGMIYSITDNLGNDGFNLSNDEDITLGLEKFGIKDNNLGSFLSGLIDWLQLDTYIITSEGLTNVGNNNNIGTQVFLDTSIFKVENTGTQKIIFNSSVAINGDLATTDTKNDTQKSSTQSEEKVTTIELNDFFDFHTNMFNGLGLVGLCNRFFCNFQQLTINSLREQNITNNVFRDNHGYGDANNNVLSEGVQYQPTKDIFNVILSNSSTDMPLNSLFTPVGNNQYVFKKILHTTQQPIPPEIQKVELDSDGANVRDGITAPYLTKNDRNFFSYANTFIDNYREKNSQYVLNIDTIISELQINNILYNNINISKVDNELLYNLLTLLNIQYNTNLKVRSIEYNFSSYTLLYKLFIDKQV